MVEPRGRVTMNVGRSLIGVRLQCMKMFLNKQLPCKRSHGERASGRELSQTWLRNLMHSNRDLLYHS